MQSKIVDKMFAYLGQNLSIRAKRLIVVSSAAAIYHKAILDDTELIAKLNRTLGLAKSNKAAAYPMYIKNVVWSGDATQKNISPSNIPTWLAYPGAEQDLLTLSVFLQNCKTVQQA